MERRTLLAFAGAALAAGCASDNATSNPGAKRREIETGVDTALAQLYARPGMRDLVSRAQGVLVFPEVFTAGLLVGGSYGQGALRKGNSTAGYYSVGAGSVGLMAGAQTKSLYLLFMTADALQKFEASKGWTIGADAAVAIADVGAEGRLDTRTAQAPIIGLVRQQSGFMANLSLEGTKFNKLNL
jgi:lipid-binding SYLF domain-containing protein